MIKSDFLCDLSLLSWLAVRGNDAESFLQAQLSNDLDILDGSHSQLHGYCNPKGRLIVVLRVARRPEGFVVQLPKTLSDRVSERLRKYVLRARVDIQSADNLRAIGFAGQRAAALLESDLGALPDAHCGFRLNDDVAIYRLPGSVPRLQVLGPEARVRSLRQKVAHELEVGAEWMWSLLDIRAGIPQIVPETTELFVPQMVNLDLVDGVSFKKGCYPGQEIVARMHYLGKLKQRMIRAEVTARARPEPGSKLYSPEYGEQSAGTVLQTERTGSDRFELLAVVQIAAYRKGALLLGAAAGPVLQPKPLPYELPMD